MRLGFIGLGNMAGAMIGGILKKGLCAPEDIIGADVFAEAAAKAKEKYGIRIAADNREVVKNADFVVLSVKPQFYADVIAGIRDCIGSEQNKIIITIAPGKTILWLEEQFCEPVKLVRCMPNTPALVLEGCTGVCCNARVTDEELQSVLTILRSFGTASVVPERLMDVVVGISGSSPAYAFMFIEALADEAVAEGMPRQQAYQFAAQALLGSAKMVLELGKHPGELEDMVCSPGGTTIQAVKVLEEQGFRAAVMDATQACIDKSRQL